MRAAAIALVGVLLVARAANAQDFESPEAGLTTETALTFLEWGMPPARARWTGDGLTIGRHSIPELTTRALAIGAGWRVLRGAVGLSQTGDPELGWTAGAAALGVSSSGGAIGVRGAARQDRYAFAEPGALGNGTGIEVGLGAWLRPAAGLVVWSAAPQLWTRGLAPPLERGLRVGVQFTWSDLSTWVEQDVRAPGLDPAVSHRAGIALDAGTTRLWTAVRDAPLRAAVGLSAAASWIGVAAEAESHPVLGETLRLAVRLHPTIVPRR